MSKILVVDDEEYILSALKRVLKSEAHTLDLFTSGKDALESSERKRFDLVISDFRMPEMDGVQFLQKFKEVQPDAIRLILSGYTDFEALLKAINKAEIFRFISKPWVDAELKSTIRQALMHQEVVLENKRLAHLVKSQQYRLDEQSNILKKLEVESPGITQVEWADDGSIIIDDSDLK